MYTISLGLYFFHFSFSLLFHAAVSINGSSFSISRVDRLNMGAYLCIASNGIPPTVSKRVMLIVHCKYFEQIHLIYIISVVFTKLEWFFWFVSNFGQSIYAVRRFLKCGMQLGTKKTQSKQHEFEC